MNNTTQKLADLLGKLCNGDLSPAESVVLTDMLLADASHRQFYRDYLDAHLTLVDFARRGESDLAIGGLAPTELEDLPDLAACKSIASTAGVSTAVYPGLKSLSKFAIAAAAMILVAIGIWQLRSLGPILDEQQQLALAAEKIAPDKRSDAADRRTDGEPLYVAQVVDLTADVTWGKMTASQEFLLRVRRGDRIEIDSGFARVDYFSGARLVLQGPCAFVPTGESSGRLEYGNLTGNVSIGDFVLTTPTAKVIDLGTEFGVSVDGVARTDVCVFVGEVRVFAGLQGDDAATSVLLHEGMSARVASGGQFAEAPNLDVRSFTRELPTSLDGLLNASEISVVDLLSGSVGNRRRLAGVIAPDTGDSDRQSWLRVDGPGYSLSNGYRETSWHPFVDGVFIPSGTGANTCLDSSGNVTDLPASTGRTWGPIWSRRRMPGAVQTASQDYWGTDTMEGVMARLSECETGMIGIHSNVGVTFDLVAIRHHWGQSVDGFRTVISNLDNSMNRMPKWAATKRFAADVRIFVDGTLRESRLDFSRDDGELEVQTMLSASDRYLTVVCTDARHGESSGIDAYDHVVLVDPVLTLSPQSADD